MADARPSLVSVLAQLPAGVLQQLVTLPPWFGILPERMWAREKRTIFVPLAPANIAPAASQDDTFRADPNHDFVGYVAAGKLRTNAAAGTPAPDDPVTVSITMEDGTGFQPSNETNEFDNVFGTARQPAFWPMPLIVPAGQAVTFRFTNNHNVDTLVIRCTLWGFLVKTS